MFVCQGSGTDRVADERKSKSFEEREEEYNEARSRIFQEQHTVSNYGIICAGKGFRAKLM